jgi:hypothetical protein
MHPMKLKTLALAVIFAFALTAQADNLLQI